MLLHEPPRGSQNLHFDPLDLSVEGSGEAALRAGRAEEVEEGAGGDDPLQLSCDSEERGSGQD